MRRDKELIRKLLLIVEAPESHLQMSRDPFERHDVPPKPTGYVRIENPGGMDNITAHFDLLIEAGFLRGGLVEGEPEFDQHRDGIVAQCFLFNDLTITWNGYEFLDSIRDPEVWKRTEAAAAKVGGVGLSVLLELAKAVAKQLVKERLGLDLG